MQQIKLICVTLFMDNQELPDTEGSAGDALKRAHANLLTALIEMEAVVRSHSPDRAMLADIRWKLSRASGVRLRLLEERIYPALLASISPIDAEKVAKLREANAPLRLASTQHVANWTLDRAVEAWPEYRQASSLMTASMRTRLNAERETLYPLLAKI
ncbi:MAG: hypothetical protein EOP62_20380 [Sphingomonadales bacterium]|nr:MAG: hypothetical protein EOP62_20380 [Sphingomonadales bacterium]